MWKFDRQSVVDDCQPFDTLDGVHAKPDRSRTKVIGVLDDFSQALVGICIEELCALVAPPYDGANILILLELDPHYFIKRRVGIRLGTQCRLIEGGVIFEAGKSMKAT